MLESLTYFCDMWNNNVEAFVAAFVALILAYMAWLRIASGSAFGFMFILTILPAMGIAWFALMVPVITFPVIAATLGASIIFERIEKAK